MPIIFVSQVLDWYLNRVFSRRELCANQEYQSLTNKLTLQFTNNNLSSISQFQLDYSTFPHAKKCGGKYNKNFGEISLFVDESVSDVVVCNYLIETAVGTHIRLNILKYESDVCDEMGELIVSRK